MSAPRRVAAIEEVPVEGTLLVTLERIDDGTRREVILTRRNGDVLAYENRCQHWRDVRLDKGDGARTRDGEIVCAKHGAIFAVESGECVHGPCMGAALAPVSVSVAGGEVTLDSPDWTVLGRGALEDRNGSPVDERGGLDF